MLPSPLIKIPREEDPMSSSTNGPQGLTSSWQELPLALILSDLLISSVACGLHFIHHSSILQSPCGAYCMLSQWFSSI